MSERFYLTTPIYYVNDVPHLGHAYTTVAADVLARYHRFQGREVFFLTGTDEHGRKVEQAAQQAQVTPKALIDRVVERYQGLWTKLGIEPSGFLRTTDPKHALAVEELWRRMARRGDIDLGVYEDWYCTPCESFWPEAELVGGKCPTCGRPVEKLKEESYFFKMSRYQEPLLRHIEEHPEFIQPEERRNEVLSFVRGGLRDLSVSRTSTSWGIRVPGNPRHVIYVWVDALANYLTATGFPSEPAAGMPLWPAQLHLIGKDILRFHAVYWPTFLLSAGLPLPERIFAHGWWTVEGQKMSKSLGNVVDPGVLADRYGADAVRYFLLREVPFGADGNFSQGAMERRITSDLANDLGNLLHRSLGMLGKYFEGRVPRPGATTDVDRALEEGARACVAAYTEALEALAFQKALIALWEFIARSNKYVDATAPWALHKAGDRERLATVLYEVFEALRTIAILIYPVLPGTARRMWGQLGIRESLGEQRREDVESWGGLRPGTEVVLPEPLFAKLEPAKESAKPARAPAPPPSGPAPAGAAAANPAPREAAPVAPAPAGASDGLIGLDAFQKVELKVGLVTLAERVPNSQKLLRLEVDLGEPAKRQVVAGIGKVYAPEALIGRRIVVVANLKPAKLMGVESRGMLLASGTEDTLKIVTLDGEIPPGTRVK